MRYFFGLNHVILIFPFNTQESALCITRLHKVVEHLRNKVRKIVMKFRSCFKFRNICKYFYSFFSLRFKFSHFLMAYNIFSSKCIWLHWTVFQFYIAKITLWAGKDVLWNISLVLDVYVKQITRTTTNYSLYEFSLG